MLKIESRIFTILLALTGLLYMIKMDLFYLVVGLVLGIYISMLDHLEEIVMLMKREEERACSLRRY